jgi:hypothetical protein
MEERMALEKAIFMSLSTGYRIEILPGVPDRLLHRRDPAAGAARRTPGERFCYGVGSALRSKVVPPPLKSAI